VAQNNLIPSYCLPYLWLAKLPQIILYNSQKFFLSLCHPYKVIQSPWQWRQYVPYEMSEYLTTTRCTNTQDHQLNSHTTLQNSHTTSECNLHYTNNKNIRNVYDIHIIHEYSHITHKDNSHTTEMKAILFVRHKEQQSMNPQLWFCITIMGK
jgi:hypothetical protein